MIKHVQDEAEQRSFALAAQLNIKESQIQRMEQQLRKLSADPEIGPLFGAMSLLNHGCDEGEGSSNGRDSAAGDINLSDGACDNAIDSDSISLISSSHHNMNLCKF